MSRTNTSLSPAQFQVSQWYELVVFTASMEIYGSAVADKLDNSRSILKRRYYRQVRHGPARRALSWSGTLWGAGEATNSLGGSWPPQVSWGPGHGHGGDGVSP